MASTTPSSQEEQEEFTLSPLHIPTDINAILRLNHQAHTNDPLHANAPRIPESEFIAARKPFYLPRFSDPSLLAFKITLVSDPQKIVSYVIFVPPSKPDRRSQEEKERVLREQLEGLHNKDLVFALKIEAMELNDKYLGKGYEARYWELAVLVTDEAYQRRGLRTRLVKWGVERLEEEVKRWKVEGEGGGDQEGEGKEKEKAKVKGVYLIASPQGGRTYEKAGFVNIGERKAEVEGLEGGYVNGWYVNLFE